MRRRWKLLLLLLYALAVARIALNDDQVNGANATCAFGIDMGSPTVASTDCQGVPTEVGNTAYNGTASASPHPSAMVINVQHPPDTTTTSGGVCPVCQGGEAPFDPYFAPTIDDGGVHLACAHGDRLHVECMLQLYTQPGPNDPPPRCPLCRTRFRALKNSHTAEVISRNFREEAPAEGVAYQDISDFHLLENNGHVPVYQSITVPPVATNDEPPRDMEEVDLSEINALNAENEQMDDYCQIDSNSIDLSARENGHPMINDDGEPCLLCNQGHGPFADHAIPCVDRVGIRACDHGPLVHAACFQRELSRFSVASIPPTCPVCRATYRALRHPQNGAIATRPHLQYDTRRLTDNLWFATDLTVCPPTGAAGAQTQSWFFCAVICDAYTHGEIVFPFVPLLPPDLLGSYQAALSSVTEENRTHCIQNFPLPPNFHHNGPTQERLLHRLFDQAHEQSLQWLCLAIKRLPQVQAVSHQQSTPSSSSNQCPRLDFLDRPVSEQIHDTISAVNPIDALYGDSSRAAFADSSCESPPPANVPTAIDTNESVRVHESGRPVSPSVLVTQDTSAQSLPMFPPSPTETTRPTCVWCPRSNYLRPRTSLSRKALYRDLQ